MLSVLSVLSDGVGSGGMVHLRCDSSDIDIREGRRKGMAQEWAASFYASPEWHKVRDYVRMRDNYTCQRCHRPMQEVHHKIHLTKANIWDVNITLNPDNLISLCRDCHFRIHEEDAGRGQACDQDYEFDESGQLVPRVSPKIF